MTQIFKDWLAFSNRENKEINGVSEGFAAENPNYEKENEDNKGCWNCSDCYGCSDCSGCSRCSDCSGCSRCSDCSRCSGCSRCYGCSDCSDCSRCYGCYGCSDLKGNAPSVMLEIPVIENIHQKVYEAAKGQGCLRMSDVHTCETTHCRAGWVVHLAGEQGYKLEQHTNWEFAAMQIYKASSPIRVSPTRFYESNEAALENMRECAEAEKLA